MIVAWSSFALRNRVLLAMRKATFGPWELHCCGVLAGSFLLQFVALSTLPATEVTVRFQEDILPLLTNRCFRCHGPDAEARATGLRLDDPEGAYAELDGGSFAIVRGDPEQSEIIRRIDSRDADLQMPPPDSGIELNASERDLLRRWVAEGAVYEEHWSFVAPVLPPLPQHKHPWARNSIDQFVLDRLKTEQLKPQSDANLYRLARRVSLALTGLPPEWSTVERLATSSSPDAYDRYVESLLSDGAYGERWARVWLDLARYADSAGYADDPPRAIWQYRDWVIRAINDNMPFDQFSIEQLAGNLLPDANESNLIATGFHRNTMTNSEGGTDDEEFRCAAVIDRVNTTMQVWMGMTMGCAQCHDHKYDPITQAEYFQFYAILNNTQDADLGDETPTLRIFSKTDQQQRADLKQQIAVQEKALAQVGDSPERHRLKELQQQLADIQGVTTPILRELSADGQRETHIHVRGNFMVQGDAVRPNAPAVFPPLSNVAKPDRLSMARWLVSRSNPLTARVVVNRVWEQLFGVGLVDTSEDFGRQGNLPSHPELLDHLAIGLMDHDWDSKWLVREIVTSSTFRQSAHVSKEAIERDPLNRLMARGPRFRLTAEMIRDQALAVSGLLSDKMLGPSVQPIRPNLGLKAAFGGSTDWETSPGEDRYRRGLYTSWRRTTPYPSMTTFDAPSREFCTVRRIRTNTPLQALVTLNDPVFVEAAQALARRIVRETPDDADVRRRAHHGFRLCLVRPPGDNEVEPLVALHDSAHQRLKDKPRDAEYLATDPLGPYEGSADVVDLAAWTVVANVMLNLDEVLSR